MAVKKAKKATPKKAPASTRKTAKKTASSKKTVAKAPAKKKTVPKKATVKTTAKKKAPAKKKVVVKTKATTKKAAAKSVAKKKAAVKKKATPKATANTAPAKKKSIAKPAPIKKPIRGAVMSDEPLVSGVTLPVEGIDPYQPTKGESYMSDEQYAHYRHILIEWKKQLMQEVDRTVDHMKTDAANYADPADRATQEEEFSLELRTRDRERKLIKKIDESLVMIDIGDYGYCESCGIEIGIRRLEARPTATQCIDCKTLQEIKEKQIYS